MAEVFNKFFVNIVPDLKIPASHNYNKDFQKTNDPVLNAISKYKYHPCIVMIKSKIDPQRKFSFTSVQYEDVPTKILIENCEYFACYIQSNQKLKHGKQTKGVWFYLL